MASPYPKFLWPLTITASGNTFAHNGGSASIPADDYDTVLEACDALETALGAGWTVAVSPIGIVTITKTSVWTVNWAGTETALSTLLGFDETEVVDGNNVLTATSQHRYGYYPGLLTYGYTLGAGCGPTNDTYWTPEWPIVEQLAGDGDLCTVGPSAPTYVRTLEFDRISRTEYSDAYIGLSGLWLACVTTAFRHYADREDGTVATPGTQNVDYGLVKIRKDGLQLNPEAGRLYYTFSLRLNLQPVPP